MEEEVHALCHALGGCDPLSLLPNFGLEAARVLHPHHRYGAAPSAPVIDSMYDYVITCPFHLCNNACSFHTNLCNKVHPPLDLEKLQG